MRRKSFEDFDCSLAQAADYLGDAWVLLILRNIFNGMRRFDEINSHLEIPTNTLSDRLKTLVGRGILRREPDPVDGRRAEYRLTPKGKGLYPIMIALVQWGECWEGSPAGPRIYLSSRTDGKPLPPVQVRDASGLPLTPRQVVAKPGPATTEHMRKLYGGNW